MAFSVRLHKRCDTALQYDRDKCFSLLRNVQIASGPTQPPIRRTIGSFPEIKRPGREVHPLFPSSTEVKNERRTKSNPHTLSWRACRLYPYLSFIIGQYRFLWSPSKLIRHSALHITLRMLWFMSRGFFT